MTAASPEKRGYLVQEDENLQPRHHDEVWSKEPFPETSMLNKANIDPLMTPTKTKDVKRTVPDQEIKQQTKRHEHEQITGQGREESGYGKSICNLLTGLSRGYSSVSDRKQIRGRRSSFGSLKPSSQQPRVFEKTGEDISSATDLEEIRRLKRKIEGLLKDNDRHNVARGKIEDDLSAIRHQNDISEDLVRKLQAKTQQLEFEKREIEEDHHTFIRKQQEASFNQMATPLWMPVEDGKVMGDLDRLKRDMRNWAKKSSVNDIDTLIKSLDQRKIAALKEALTNVVLFENGSLPWGLSAKKSPSLLLTALLAHHIYKTLFESPFFFIDDNMVDGRYVQSEYRVGLELVYDKGRCSNEEDAHIWRSDFLRLQLPPITPETSEGGKSLRRMTQAQIDVVADRQALNFLEGAAQYLISNEDRKIIADKLGVIYREAANTSYMLWTRRTALRIFTLKTIGSQFRPEFKHLVPHSSVDYEKHDDQLRGRAISIVVHPLVAVYGTDDAKDYDHNRVWAPAEVWLNS
ncbi:hypothetical protein H4I96_05474 [Botrytis cinerea]